MELGAEVIAVAASPTAPTPKQRRVHRDKTEPVVAHGADPGSRRDGDADRPIVADDKGAVIDGDQLMRADRVAWLPAKAEGRGICAT